MDKSVKLIIKADGKQAESTLKSLRGEMTSFAGSAVTAGAAIGAAGLAKMAYDLVQVNAEYQKLGASLTTVTGSSAAAKVAFDGLTKFAANTPYQVDEVVSAFIKLKARGLDPSMDALRSYGNSASAMGKDLDQMIEAVGDAASGEFERLKEGFGITAKSAGDQVTFTFQGVSTTVKKNAAEITKYIQDIGNTKFGDAMSKQMDTIGGAFSNLEDAYKSMLVQIGSDSKVNSGLIASIHDLTGALQDPAFISALTNVADLLAKAALASISIGSKVTNESFELIAEFKNFVSYGAKVSALRNRSDLRLNPEELAAELAAAKQIYEYSKNKIDQRYNPEPLQSNLTPPMDRPGDAGYTPPGRNRTTATPVSVGGFNMSSSIGEGFSLDGSTQEMGGSFSLSGGNEGLTPQDQFSLDSQTMLFGLKLQGMISYNDEEASVMQGHQGWLTEIFNEGEASRLAFAQASSGQKLQTITGDLISMTAAAAGSNAAMFRINQAARIVDAGQDGVRGAIKTWNTYPYPWNIPMTALHVAGTAAVMSNLIGASPQGGSTRIGQGGGTSTSPVVTQPSAQIAATPAAPQVNVTILGNVVDQDAFARVLIPSIQKAFADGVA